MQSVDLSFTIPPPYTVPLKQHVHYSIFSENALPIASQASVLLGLYILLSLRQALFLEFTQNSVSPRVIEVLVCFECHNRLQGICETYLAIPFRVKMVWYGMVVMKNVRSGYLRPGSHPTAHRHRPGGLIFAPPSPSCSGSLPSTVQFQLCKRRCHPTKTPSTNDAAAAAELG